MVGKGSKSTSLSKNVKITVSLVYTMVTYETKNNYTALETMCETIIHYNAHYL